MKILDFYSRVGSLPKAYKWNGLTATRNGSEFNPITAVVNYKSGVICKNTKSDTVKAGQLLGLSKQDSVNIYEASRNVSNHGYQQVVRGRLKNVLGVE